jgi:hypothetical protein
MATYSYPNEPVTFDKHRRTIPAAFHLVKVQKTTQVPENRKKNKRNSFSSGMPQEREKDYASRANPDSQAASSV